MSNKNSTHLKLDGLSAKELKQFCFPEHFNQGLYRKKDFPQSVQRVWGNINLARVRSDIEALMRDRSHDDGSYAPLLIRFAWHNCGTYDKSNNTGGSNGATMRFHSEKNDPENSGLSKAIKLLSPIVEKYPWLSTADIWILAGYVAIEVSGGPSIPFCFGRKDSRKRKQENFMVTCFVRLGTGVESKQVSLAEC